MISLIRRLPPLLTQMWYVSLLIIECVRKCLPHVFVGPRSRPAPQPLKRRRVPLPGSAVLAAERSAAPSQRNDSEGGRSFGSRFDLLEDEGDGGHSHR